MSTSREEIGNREQIGIASRYNSVIAKNPADPWDFFAMNGPFCERKGKASSIQKN